MLVPPRLVLVLLAPFSTYTYNTFINNGDMKMFQVCLMEGRRVIKKELFKSMDAAWAFFDANSDKYECEFRDLKYYDNWRYTAN